MVCYFFLLFLPQDQEVSVHVLGEVDRHVDSDICTEDLADLRCWRERDVRARPRGGAF